MGNTLTVPYTKALTLSINPHEIHWVIIGSGTHACKIVRQLLSSGQQPLITVFCSRASEGLHKLQSSSTVTVVEKEYEATDLAGAQFVVAATGNPYLDQCVKDDAALQHILVYLPDAPELSDFIIEERAGAKDIADVPKQEGYWFQKNSDQPWRQLASRLVFAFLLMVLGHIIISNLPLSTFPELWTDVKPYFDKQFLFFVLAGFLAQMVDGMLSMGYGVTSATCLISFGVNPVAVSAAIHTSEVFASGISGYSHYKFGNVNKKLFRHLVIPGVIGAILGAIMLVFLGEKAGSWLMPVMALYAMFLGLKILFKAFQVQTKAKKVKRIGWLAGTGGFLDSFGGGGWGPIVTSSLMAKGRSPKYTIGSVSLTEFFVTLASALTFFVTVGVSHWNIVLGLLIGGAIAAPFAARLAGKLPRKTMMIAVGIMVMIWCIRMFIKSIA